jgi:hypothetical protein
MRVIRASAFVMAVWLAAASGATAHHGIANFDLNRELQITGTVTALRLVNPHSWLHLDVTERDGSVTKWRCELRGASVLRRSGWSADMFAPGTTVTVTGAPDRFTPNTCYLATAVFSDGRRVDRYGQLRASVPAASDATSRPARAARRPDGRPNFAGDWAAEQRMLTDPRGISGAFVPLSVAKTLEPGAVPEGMQPFPGSRGSAISLAENPVDAYWNRPGTFPLTAAGQQAIADFDGGSSDNPRLRCEPTNILFDWTFETDVNRITQDADRITLLYGSMNLERTIHLGVAEHPKDVAPTRAGHSIGRWEGNVLVVETIGFEPGILSADARIPHSNQLRVTERFTLDAEKGTLTRGYVAEDPLYLQKPFTGADTVQVADVPYQPAVCDDQSYKTTKTEDAGAPPADTSTTRWLIWGGVLVAAGVALLVVASLRRRSGTA